MRRIQRLAILTATSTSLIILGANYGLPKGSKMPAFEAPDQNGKRHGLTDILGPNGAVVVFFRSADW